MRISYSKNTEGRSSCQPLLRELSSLILDKGAEDFWRGINFFCIVLLGYQIRCQFMMGYQNFDRFPTINTVYILSVKCVLFLKNMNKFSFFQNECLQAKSYLK